MILISHPMGTHGSESRMQLLHLPSYLIAAAQIACAKKWLANKFQIKLSSLHCRSNEMIIVIFINFCWTLKLHCWRDYIKMAFPNCGHALNGDLNTLYCLPLEINWFRMWIWHAYSWTTTVFKASIRVLSFFLPFDHLFRFVQFHFCFMSIFFCWLYRFSWVCFS